MGRGGGSLHIPEAARGGSNPLLHASLFKLESPRDVLIQQLVDLCEGENLELAVREQARNLNPSFAILDNAQLGGTPPQSVCEQVGELSEGATRSIGSRWPSVGSRVGGGGSTPCGRNRSVPREPRGG